MTRKWNIVNDSSKANYNAGNEIPYNTEVLKSNLCDYNDTYILVKGDITVTAATQTYVSFEKCAPFTKCIIKIDGTTIDNAEYLALVMPVCNLIKYSSNYSETTESLCFYSKHKAKNFNNNIANTNNFKSFKCKAKLLGNTVDQPDNANNDNADKFTFCNLISKKQSKLSKLFSKGFERSVYWNEHKTKSGKKNTTNEFRYFLLSNFARVNRLFVLVYPDRNNESKRFFIRKCYLPKGIIKNYNVIINGKTFIINQSILI